MRRRTQSPWPTKDPKTNSPVQSIIIDSTSSPHQHHDTRHHVLQRDAGTTSNGPGIFLRQRPRIPQPDQKCEKSHKASVAASTWSQTMKSQTDKARIIRSSFGVVCSRNTKPAMTPVSSGCSPTTSAVTPVEMPNQMP